MNPFEYLDFGEKIFAATKRCNGKAARIAVSVNVSLTAKWITFSLNWISL